MDPPAIDELEALEHILIDPTAEPTKISYAVLKSITDNFSDSRVIGRGAFGVVYKGVLSNGKQVAVKKLKISPDFSDRLFEDEVTCLYMVKHKNIVRFLGYCPDTLGDLIEIDGRLKIVEVPLRLLCFEFVPNGSLHHLKDKSHGDDWNMRYKIIKGICLGLCYLHEKRINHLDLKPENVLLDDNMEPKISDFGLSRCFDGEQSRAFTQNRLRGTLGYIPPELIDKGEISFKSDIFSLGIILNKLITGCNVSNIETGHQPMDIYCQQIDRCTQIAQRCVDSNQHERPTICEIIAMLDETENIIHNVAPDIDEPKNDQGFLVFQIIFQSFLTIWTWLHRMIAVRRCKISYVSKSNGELQSTVDSTTPSEPQRINSIPNKSGEPSSTVISLVYKSNGEVHSTVDSTTPSEQQQITSMPNGEPSSIVTSPVSKSNDEVQSTVDSTTPLEPQQVTSMPNKSREPSSTMVSPVSKSNGEVQSAVDSTTPSEPQQITSIPIELIEPSSTVISPVSKSNGEVQSTVYSTTPSEPQRITSMPNESGEPWSSTVISLVSKLNGEVQSMVDSTTLSEPQRMTTMPTELGEPSNTVMCPPGFSESTKLLDVHPIELYFPYKPNMLITCPVTLTNRTDHHVGFWFESTGSYTQLGGMFHCSSLFGIVEPHGTWVVTVTMKKQQQLPPPPRETDKFEVLTIAMRSDYDLQLLKSPIGRALNKNNDYLKQSRSERVMLTPIIGGPTICPAVESQANASVSQLVDEVQSVAFSAAPSRLQRLISVSEGIGDAGTEIRRGETSELLDIYPLELCFPWEPNKCITYPVNLTNRTDSYVGVLIRPTRPDARFDFNGIFQIMKPHSTWAVCVTTKEQHVHQPAPRDKCIFEVLMIVMSSRQHLQNLSSTGSKLKLDNSFLKQIEELAGELHHAMLTAFFDFDTPSYKAATHQVIPTAEFGDILSIDVHPSDTWILARNHGGYVSVWNYSTQEKVVLLRDTEQPRPALSPWSAFYGVELFEHVQSQTRPLSKTFGNPWRVGKDNNYSSDPSLWLHSAKFIAVMKWFATGDRHGWIDVYDYTTRRKVARFEAHSNEPVDSLAVHPTCPLLLSSSSSRRGSSIKLWNWDDDWVCTRTFCCRTEGVLDLTWNPLYMDIFASISKDGKAEIRSIGSSDPITALDVESSFACFSTNSNNRHLVTCGIPNKCADIWDWQTKERVHSLGVIGRPIRDVACHPTHPILVTSLDDGTVCLWDAKTLRIEKMVRFAEGLPQDLVFTETRLVVAYTDGIAIMDTNVG